MSYKGQYLRGEKWYNLSRDADGNLTGAIKKDLEKMKDINVFLEAKAKKEEEAKAKAKPVTKSKEGK